MYFDQYVDQQQDGDVVVCKFAGDISFLNINADIKHIAKVNKKVKLILSFSSISYIDIDGIEVFGVFFCFAYLFLVGWTIIV